MVSSNQRVFLLTVGFLIASQFDSTASHFIVPKSDFEGEESGGKTESWEALETKLDFLLESEKREKELLAHLINGPTPTSPISTSTAETPNPSNAGNKDQLRLDTQTASPILKKLEENSRRIESMVVFLADLRNVLSEAVASQEKQLGIRTEVSELREEVENLRDELKKVKSEREGDLRTPTTIQNKLHNEEMTIEWMKTGLKELRSEMTEVASSINITGLLHLKQEWEGTIRRVEGDFKGLEKNVESLEADRARTDEAVLEIRADVADVRTWQAKMGEKFMGEEPMHGEMIRNELSSMTGEPGIEEENLEKTLLAILNPSTESTKEEADSHRRRHRHDEKKLIWTALRGMGKVMLKTQRLASKRLTRLELSRKILKTHMKKLEDQVGSFEREENEIESKSRIRRRDLDRIEPTARSSLGLSNGLRISSLERSLADYATTLTAVDEKVNGLEQLRDSNAQLFTSLEALESKYDERLTDMQTGLAKMEATVSSISNINEDLKEQQDLQSKRLQGSKKDFIRLKDQFQTNHLRLAALQSQILKWGLKSCTDQSSESIQNIKIASLESQLMYGTTNEEETWRGR